MTLSNILPISFEFSPKLGIREQPELSSTHESSVPGLYVVGDLADAPIIKVALNQGHDVAARIAKELGDPSPDDDVLDVIVVGAGPAGIGAALALTKANMRYAVIEKERPFNTIQNFPKAKHVFSEPRSISNRGGFWFEDSAKETLVERWSDALDERAIVLHQPESVVAVNGKKGAFEVHTKVGTGGRLSDHPHADLPGVDVVEGATNIYRCKRVILAIGRRADVRRLGCEGEDLPKVSYVLRDPDDHKDENVLIVGGGDSAVEAAISCAEAGANVAISYRKDAFSRAKTGNQEKISALIDAGKITPKFNTTVREIGASNVTLQGKGSEETIENDRVMIFIGTKLPKKFLSDLGLRMAGTMDFWRAAWITSFALATYLFYVLKSGTVWSESAGMFIAKKAYFPFGPDHLLGSLPHLLHVDLGFRQVDGSFWGTVCYSLMIVGFGIAAYRRYPSPVQKRRYLSLMMFQAVFLFGIPEILAPIVINGSEFVANIFGGDRAWKIYALTVPWPLNIWALIDAPGWAGGNTAAAVGWLIAGALVAFVAMPLFVWRNNEKFCSYLCGCGGLAETLGDRWRHLAPRGKHAKQLEGAGRLILLAAIPVTLLIVLDAWQMISSGALLSVKSFAQHWYTLMVDFWLASVVGVALYPYLGNRAWCRFFCPLRAYMEWLSKAFGRLAIHANDKCIGCGECTRFCQMGIDVQSFAQRQTSFDNATSACIQCGICVQVCPMDTLSLGPKHASKSAA